MFEHPEGGLEARVESECRHCRPTGMFFFLFVVFAGRRGGRGKRCVVVCYYFSTERYRYMQRQFVVFPPSFPSALTRLLLEQFLFLEPNASDPLNKEAAEDLRSNREGFKRNVRSSMGGGSVKGGSYDRVMK